MGTPGNVDAKTSGHKVLIELINRPGLPEKALVQAIRALGALEVGLQRLTLELFSSLTQIRNIPGKTRECGLQLPPKLSDGVVDHFRAE
jgi:hypothetical protein